MWSVLRVLVCHESEERDMLYLFLAGQTEPDSFSHVCWESDGSWSSPSSLACIDSDWGDGYRQVACSDGTVSLSWPSVSLLGTLRELHVEYSQDGQCATKSTFWTWCCSLTAFGLCGEWNLVSTSVPVWFLSSEESHHHLAPVFNG